MSHANGHAKTAAGAVARILRNPTKAYTPTGFGHWGPFSAFYDGKPWFTWLDIPRMQRDPRIRFLEKVWRSPFQQAQWNVKTDNAKVKAFVDLTLRKFWTGSLPKLLSHYFRWGYAPGGAEFCHQRGYVRLERVRAIEPTDARAMLWRDGPGKGQFAGFSAGNICVLAPHSFWFAGLGEIHQMYDVPPMAGAFEPWTEKRGRNGAIDCRRSWYRKNAARGGTLRHPPGTSNVGTEENPSVRDNADLAREVMDYVETNGYSTLTNEAHPGLEGHYAWELEPPQSYPDTAGFREYPQDLDKEMSEGIGIPNEVFEAADVGSGWSGRMIPLQAWLGGVDELIGLIIEQCATSWLKFVVEVNFGRNAWFEIEPTSLVKMVQDQAKGGPGGSEGANPIPGLMGGGGPPPGAGGGGVPGGGGGRGGHSGVPYSGPRGGHGYMDPKTRRVHYLSTGEAEGSPIPTETRKRVRRLLRERDLVEEMAEAAGSKEARELWLSTNAPVMAPQPVRFL